MSEKSPACLNCGGAPAGPFCQGCGQKAVVQRLQPNGLAGDVIGSILDFETGVWRTFLGLLTRPGEVAREYVGGKRRRYVNPLKYLLFALAVYFVLASALDVHLSDLSAARITVTDGQEQQQEEAAKALIEFLDSQQRLLILAGVPIYAWTLGLLFRRRGYNFAEVCVLLLYAFAQTTLMIRLPMMLWSAATGRSLLLLALPLQVLYFTWVSKRFFDTTWWRALLAAGASFLAWFTALVALIGACVAVAVSLS